MRMKSLRLHQRKHDGYTIVDGEIEAAEYGDEEVLDEMIEVEPKSEFAITVSMDSKLLETYVLGST